MLLFKALCCRRSPISCTFVQSGLSSRLFQAGAKVIGEAVWKGNGANPHGNQRELIRTSHAEPVHPRADKHRLQHSGVNRRARALATCFSRAEPLILGTQRCEVHAHCARLRTGPLHCNDQSPSITQVLCVCPFFLLLSTEFCRDSLDPPPPRPPKSMFGNVVA